MKAPILSPSFKWHPAQSHSDPQAFRDRQRARLEAAQTSQKVRFIPIKLKEKTK